MHKKIFPDKLDRPAGGHRNAIQGDRSRHNAGTVKSPRGQPDSVKNILARATPALTGIAQRVREQQDLKDWTRSQLPAELVSHVTEVLEKSGELAVFAESAAWAGRLRYAVEDLKAALAADRPELDIKSVRIRVMPRNSS